MKRKGLKIKKEEEGESTKVVKEEDSGSQNCKRERIETEGASETEVKLRAIQDVKVEKPSWLTLEMKKVKLEENPTPTEIKLQLRLPSTSEGFQEPVKIWEVRFAYSDFCLLHFYRCPFFQGDRDFKCTRME